jgi:hypothetical protein
VFHLSQAISIRHRFCSLVRAFLEDRFSWKGGVAVDLQQKRMGHWIASGTCAIFSGAFAAPAAAAVVTFEELTDGTAVRDAYQASMGVTFGLATAVTAGLSLNDLEFPPHSGSNVAYDNTGAVSINFTHSMQSVFAYFTYVTPLKLFAYDDGGHLLQSVQSAYGNNTAVSGDTSSRPNELLGFLFTNPQISMVTISGDPGGSSFTFDDLTFGSANSAVPEPGNFGLVLIALLGGVWSVRRRRTLTPRRSSVQAVISWSPCSPAVCALVLAMGAVRGPASAQDQPRPAAAASANKLSSVAPTTASAAVTAVSIERIKTSPSAIPNGIATTVVVAADVSGTNVLLGGVSVQVIDDGGKVLRSLGPLNDAGAAPDAVAGDGRYTGSFVLNESTNDALRLVVSVAFKNTLLRSVSKPFYLNVNSGTAVLNAARDFWAVNNGPDGISLYFGGGLPDGAQQLRLLRAPAGSSAWTTVWTRDIDFAGVALPLFDSVDGSTGQFVYRLQVFGAGEILLKEFGSITLPMFVGDAGAAPVGWANSFANRRIGVNAAANVPAVDPVVNTAFMSDAVYEDSTSMTAQQILDFLTAKGSFLATASLTEPYTDTDGTALLPATYIKQLAQQYTINPQLILVTMEKESGMVRASARPADPVDGYMGAKSCAHTIRAQLDCGVSRMRAYLSDLDTTGQTVSGWAPGVTKKTCAGAHCSLENLDVTPANRATAALWTYTPVVGAFWGGTPDYGGASLNVRLWYPSFFKDLTHIVRWKDCGLCPQAPEVNPPAGEARGAKIIMGSPVLPPPENAMQSKSRHGLSGRLPANSSYAVELDCSLNTWDAYDAPTANGKAGYWDVFLVSLSAVPHWLTGLADPITAPYRFGGITYGDGLPDRKAERFKRSIPAAALGEPYLNLMFDTASLPHSDNNYPSWGECKVLRITPTDALSALGLIRMPN